MQILLTVLLVLLVGTMVLVPPLALARAVWRVAGMIENRVAAMAWILGAALPVLLNFALFAGAWTSLSQGKLVLDSAMAAAVLVSWLSFVGRVTVGRISARRARPSY